MSEIMEITDSSITLSCAVSPDTESATLQFRAPFGGKNPLDPTDPGPDGQAAEYITDRAEFVKFKANGPDDTLMIVWFFSA